MVLARLTARKRMWFAQVGRTPAFLIFPLRSKLDSDQHSRAYHLDNCVLCSSPMATPQQPDGKIEVRNVNVPSHVTRVDRAKYEAICKALFKVLPERAPGLTQSEMFAAVVPHLPQTLFPGGAKVAWWVKTVHLDQEAKGGVVRDPGRPLRWRRG